MGLLAKARYKLRRAFPVESWYMETRHRLVNAEVSYPDVQWLSHHIPKTAGRSLEAAFQQAFGNESVHRVYSDTSAPKRLSTGMSMWTSNKTVIVHGHYRPHTNHLTQFPNARRIIWIRDPLSRAASLLSYIEGRRMDKVAFEQFKAKYPASDVPFEQRLFALITDKSLFEQVFVYSTWLRHSNPEDFAFIGRQENYQADLHRLSDLLGVHLTPLKRNASTHVIDLEKPEELQKLLEEDYIVYDKWLHSVSTV